MEKPVPFVAKCVGVLQVLFGLVALVLAVAHLGGFTDLRSIFSKGAVSGFQKDLDQYLGMNVPGYAALVEAEVGLTGAMSVLMLFGGAALLAKQGWGRTLTMVWAAASVAYRIAIGIYGFSFVIPGIQEFTRMRLGSGHPRFNDVMFESYVGTILPMVLMIYPLLVMILLSRSVREAFQSPKARRPGPGDSGGPPATTPTV